MKLKLTLTKPQYEGFYEMTKNLVRGLRNESDLEIFSFRTAMEDLALKLTPAIINGVKKQQTIKLTEMQTLAFWQLLNADCGGFDALQHALSINIVRQIDIQHRMEQTQRSAVRESSYDLKQIR